MPGVRRTAGTDKAKHMPIPDPVFRALKGLRGPYTREGGALFECRHSHRGQSERGAATRPALAPGYSMIVVVALTRDPPGKVGRRP
jgi:hypothetical protein